MSILVSSVMVKDMDLDDKYEGKERDIANDTTLPPSDTVNQKLGKFL